MSYDAGSIDSRLTLDRSPFSRELRAARDEAREFERNPVTIRLEVDRRRAEAELRAFEARMDIATRARDVIINVQTRQSEQRIRELENRLNGSGNAARKLGQDAQKSLGLMRTAIEFGLPPIVTLTSGLLGASSALVGLGPAAILAFKGAGVEIKQRTEEGQAYQGVLTNLKSSLTQLEHTAALGALPGAQMTVLKLNQELPQFNALMVTSSQVLGDVTQHLVGGLIGGLRTFTPLILQAEHGADRLAGRFESWATGPGGERFADRLSTDMQLIGPVLVNLGTLGAHALAALDNTGRPILTLLGQVSGVLAKLPVGVLTALTEAYLTFRTVVAVTSGINAAAAALRGLTAAEVAATAGARGGAAGAGLSRIAGLGVAAYIGSGFADNNSWQTSTNSTKRFVGEVGQTIDNITHFKFNSILSDLRADNAKAQTTSNLRSAVNAATGTGTTTSFLGGTTRTGGGLNALYDPSGSYASGTSAVTGHGSITPIPRGTGSGAAALGSIFGNPGLMAAAVVGATKATQAITGLTNAEVIGQKAASTYHAFTNDLNTSLGRLSVVARHQSIDEASQSYSDFAGNLEKTANSQKKWLDQGGPYITTIAGMKIGQKTFSAALQETNGDTVKAIGLIQGRIQSYRQTGAALDKLTEEQTNLNNAVGAAEDKYKLTSDQVSQYAQLVGVSADAVANGLMSQDEFVAKIGEVRDALANGSTAVDGWVAAVDRFNKTGDTAASRGALIAAAMVSFNGDAISYANTMAGAATANQQLINDFANLKTGVINLKTGFIDYHNAGAAPILNDLQSLQTAAMNAAAATYQHEVATGHSSTALKDAAAVYRNDTYGALVDQARQLGLTKDQAEKLAQRYFHWPKDAKTQIEALGAKDTNTLLDALGRQLSILTGSPWLITVNGDVNDAVTKLNNLHQVILDSTGTFVVTGSGRHGSALGNIYEKYASGGLENHAPQIAMPGANRVRIWAEPETRGEAYIPLANDYRRPRAQAIASETARRLGGVAFFDGGGIESGGFTGQTVPVPSKTKAQTAAASQSKTLESIAAAAAVAATLLGNNKLVTGSASWISSTISRVQAALSRAQTAKAVPNALVIQFNKDNHELTLAVQQRDKIAQNLKAANAQLIQDQKALSDYGHSVRDTFLNQFDIGTSGNGYAYGIKSSLEQAIKDTQKFDTLRAKAQQMHLDPRLVQQLEQEGPAGAKNLEAIVNAGQSYVNSINSDYSALYKASSKVGDQAAKDNIELNKQIASDTKSIAHLNAQELAAQRAVKKELVDIRRDTYIMRQDLAGALAAARKKA